METESSCCKKILFKAPLWSGRKKLGLVWGCPECLNIIAYEGLFAWAGWHLRQGAQGFGCYYAGKGLTKKQKEALKSSSNHLAPSHGLARTEALAHNAWVIEND